MKGAIATGSRESAEAGASVLREGGNAADAAIAALLASFSSEMISTGPGSGGLATVREPDGNLRLFNFFSAAPGIGLDEEDDRPAMDFRKKDIKFGSADLSFHIGRASSAVPGVLKGVEFLHSHYATLPLDRLAAPAIALATEGVLLNPMQLLIGRSLKPILGDTPELLAICGGQERFLAEGQPIVNAPLGRLLEVLGRDGAESFYTGKAAAAIVADQQAHGGLITAADLAEYQVIETKPFGTEGAGWVLRTPGPPALGGTMIVLLLRGWRILEEEFGSCSLDSADYRHRWCLLLDLINANRGTIEAIRQAESAPEYIEHLLERRMPDVAKALRERRPLREGPTRRIPGNTAHLSVIDANGLGVAITSSPGESAGYLVPGLGMIMNNMMGEEDLHPHGFHRLEPGERLPTMMAPSVLERQGTVMLFGSGGSVRIRSALSQFVHLATERRMDLREAIEWPRVHFEDWAMQLEGETNAERIAALEATGYTVKAWADRTAYFGGINGVSRAPDGVLTAHADPRRGGHAIVI